MCVYMYVQIDRYVHMYICTDCITVCVIDLRDASVASGVRGRVVPGRYRCTRAHTHKHTHYSPPTTHTHARTHARTHCIFFEEEILPKKPFLRNSSQEDS